MAKAESRGQSFKSRFFLSMRNYRLYRMLADSPMPIGTDPDSPLNLDTLYPTFIASLEFLDELQALQGRPVPVTAEEVASLHPDELPPTEDDLDKWYDVVYQVFGPTEVPIEEVSHHEVMREAEEVAAGWRADWVLFKRGKQAPPAPPRRKKRSAPRDGPKNAVAVHSSAPVYDIGETIARGNFTLPDGGRFPSADIVGNTQGRIELLPFWDHVNNRPLTPQSINLMASAATSEFSRMQEEAVAIATSYNEEMATYFYAMDAYWLMNAQNEDDYVELDISNLLQYTGKKPVKTHGRYTGTYRPDQLQRAGMMVYGMGFSMVEIERAVIKGVGERAHYKRLWDVTDMYVMETLDNESYIESMTYRPNEFFRGVSFGSRRETALIMTKVLGLDYAKMVVARRLGRYYTWLWRDRAYSGDIAAGISCKRLLERAGIEPEPGKERYARRSLEIALDRLEVEGIIAQWVLLDRNGEPADLDERVPFRRWLEMKISVSPPDTILLHYGGAESLQPRELPAPAALDVELLRRTRAEKGYTLAMLSAETGVELSTLSRIATGKTKRPRAEHVKAINAWLEAVARQAETFPDEETPE